MAKKETFHQLLEVSKQDFTKVDPSSMNILEYWHDTGLNINKIAIIILYMLHNFKDITPIEKMIRSSATPDQLIIKINSYLNP
jgi:hypothetical protein